MRHERNCKADYVDRAFGSLIRLARVSPLPLMELLGKLLATSKPIIEPRD